MLDQLFKKSPAKSHNRSESSPHLPHSLTHSFFPSGSTLSDNVRSDELPIAPTRRGEGREKGHSFDASILTEPVNALQSDRNSSKRIPRDLPPLLLSPIALETPTKSQNIALNTDIHDFARCPERSPQPSPSRLKGLSIPVLTADHIERVKKESTPNKIAGWFNGLSEPINIGILPSPIKDKADPLSIMPLTTPAQPSPKPVVTSRFSFLSTKFCPAKRSFADSDPNDEFLSLDISTALFPTGPADPFSPSSFKNLVQNAEGLLTRLQAAYKERTISLREMTAEKDTIAEELEGAETRSKHLKIQLDDMSAKLTEQDNAMMELVDELANVKRLRFEEEEARKRSIRTVKPSLSTPGQGEEQELGGRGQNVCRRQRRDRLSSTSTTDCDSEDESSAESLFSKGNSTSPRMSLSSVSTMSSPDTYHHPELPFTGISPSQAARRQAARPPSGSSKIPRDEGLVWSCGNCQGGAASEAWGVVSMLKDENKCLKERVQHVEGALEGCLDVVARLG